MAREILFKAKMKKMLLVLIVSLIPICFMGCGNKADSLTINGKSAWIFDDVSIDAKEGYFYDSHEKFTVDENTIGLTIYFSTDADDSWDSEVAENE